MKLGETYRIEWGRTWNTLGNPLRTWWACRTRTGIGPKLCILLHSYGDLCYWLHIYFLTLLLSTHNQHQNMCLCIGNELHHPSTMNYTLSTPKTYVYAWVVNLIIPLPQTTHNQHQNMCLCIGNDLHHSPTMNYTLSTPKTIKTKSLSKNKTSIITLYSNHDFLQREVVFLKVTNTPLYTNQKETSQETSWRLSTTWFPK